MLLLVLEMIVIDDNVFPLCPTGRYWAPPLKAVLKLMGAEDHR